MMLFTRKRAGTPARHSGEALAELDRALEANRADPDPEREREIVRFRHDAFSELPEVAPNARYPEAEFRPIQTIEELPAVSPSELTAGTVRAGIVSGGCLLVRGLIGPETSASLREGIDRGLESREAEREDEWHHPLRIGGGAYNLARQRRWVNAASGMWAADSPRVAFQTAEVFRESGLSAVIAEYLGSRPVASVNKWTLRRVGAQGAADWHQDGAFLGEGIRALNVWLCLSDCGIDAPGMDIVPRSLHEIAPTGTEGARFDWSVAPAEVERACDGTEPVRPNFKAGDALLFDQMLMHKTAAEADMPNLRHAIETWCFAPGAYPDKQVPLVL